MSDSGQKQKPPSPASGGGKTSSGGSSGSKSAKPRAIQYETELRELFRTFSGGARMLGGDLEATVLENRADDLARAWAKLAKDNDYVARIIGALLSGSSWGEAIMVSASVAIPIIYYRSPGSIPDEVGLYFLMSAAPEFVASVPQSRETREHAERQQQAARQPSDTQPQPEEPPNPNHQRTVEGYPDDVGRNADSGSTGG